MIFFKMPLPWQFGFQRLVDDQNDKVTKLFERTLWEWDHNTYISLIEDGIPKVSYPWSLWDISSLIEGASAMYSGFLANNASSVFLSFFFRNGGSFLRGLNLDNVPSEHIFILYATGLVSFFVLAFAGSLTLFIYRRFFYNAKIHNLTKQRDYLLDVLEKQDQLVREKTSVFKRLHEMKVSFHRIDVDALERILKDTDPGVLEQVLVHIDPELITKLISLLENMM